MNEKPLHSYMSIGIVHFMAFPECLKGQGPIIETLTRIAEDPFFTAVEMGPIVDVKVRHAAAALLASCGLKVGFGCQPMQLVGRHDLNSLNDGYRQSAIECCLEGLEQAVDLGAEKFSVMSGPDPGEAFREEAMDALVKSLTFLGEHCRNAGLQLCLETFDYDIDKRCLIGPNSLAVIVSQRVREQVPDFGLLVDLSHLPLQHESIRSALTATQEHLVHVHIGNCVLDPSNPAYGDQHPRFGYPGGMNGVNELREFLATLLNIGYLKADSRASVAFEIKPASHESSTAVIAQAKRTLVHAWTTLELSEASKGGIIG